MTEYEVNDQPCGKRAYPDKKSARTAANHRMKRNGGSETEVSERRASPTGERRLETGGLNTMSNEPEPVSESEGVPAGVGMPKRTGTVREHALGGRMEADLRYWKEAEAECVAEGDFFGTSFAQSCIKRLEERIAAKRRNSPTDSGL